jgi:hypothetical protein
MGAAAKKVFGAYVHVVKPNGTSEAFAPGDVVPAWAAKLVGDHVLAEPETDASPEQQPPATPTVPSAPASTDGGTPDAEQELAALKAKLEEIGQPTDGGVEELQKRLAEHGE